MIHHVGGKFLFMHYTGEFEPGLLTGIIVPLMQSFHIMWGCLTSALYLFLKGHLIIPFSRLAVISTNVLIISQKRVVKEFFSYRLQTF